MGLLHKYKARLAALAVLTLAMAFMFNNCQSAKKGGSTAALSTQANLGFDPKNVDIASLKSTDKLPMFLESSEKFAEKLKDPSISANGKKLFLLQKFKIDNLIAATIIAESCADLYKIVPSLESGTYLIYPGHSASYPYPVRCQINNGSVAMLPLGDQHE